MDFFSLDPKVFDLRVFVGVGGATKINNVTPISTCAVWSVSLGVRARGVHWACMCSVRRVSAVRCMSLNLKRQCCFTVRGHCCSLLSFHLFVMFSFGAFRVLLISSVWIELPSAQVMMCWLCCTSNLFMYSHFDVLRAVKYCSGFLELIGSYLVM